MRKKKVMAVCTCSKEGEISEIHTDIKWIKNALQGITGNDGLVKQVSKNSSFRIGSQAKQRMITAAIGGGWIFTLLGWLLYFMGHK